MNLTREQIEAWRHNFKRWATMPEAVQQIDVLCDMASAAHDLLKALKYARRMVDTDRADLAFIDAAITKAEGK